jgi:hypothetical protein
MRQRGGARESREKLGAKAVAAGGSNGVED